MKNNDLLQTLSGCRFYQDYLQTQEAAKPPTPQEPKPSPLLARRQIDAIFRKYSLLLGGLLVSSVILLVLPLWLVSGAYGRACLLGLPPMIICALSWMAGAWWAWDKDQRVLMAITVGAMPLRILVVLSWVWLVLTIPEVPATPLVLCLMWYWILFAVPEFAMLMELSQRQQAARVRQKPRGSEVPLEQGRASDEIRVRIHAIDRRLRQPHPGPGNTKLAGRVVGKGFADPPLLR